MGGSEIDLKVGAGIIEAEDLIDATRKAWKNAPGLPFYFLFDSFMYEGEEE